MEKLSTCRHCAAVTRKAMRLLPLQVRSLIPPYSSEEVLDMVQCESSVPDHLPMGTHVLDPLQKRAMLTWRMHIHLGD